MQNITKYGYPVNTAGMSRPFRIGPHAVRTRTEKGLPQTVLRQPFGNRIFYYFVLACSTFDQPPKYVMPSNT